VNHLLVHDGKRPASANVRALNFVRKEIFLEKTVAIVRNSPNPRNEEPNFFAVLFATPFLARRFSSSREETTHQRRFRYAANGERHGGGAWWHVMLAHHLDHVVKRANHNLLQPHIHFFGIP